MPLRHSAAERLERLPLSPYHRLIFVIIALASSSTPWTWR
jgi:putative MFS transporter